MILVGLKTNKEDIYMNQQEIFDRMYALTKEKYAICKSEAENIGENHPTERGALQLRAGIYDMAINAGFLSGTEQAMGLMSKRFEKLVTHFPELCSYYQSLSKEEQGIMEIALYPEVFLRLNFREAYNADLADAEKDGDPQKIFKAKIKKEVLGEVLDMWRNFRAQNDLFAFAFEDKDE